MTAPNDKPTAPDLTARQKLSDRLTGRPEQPRDLDDYAVPHLAETAPNDKPTMPKRIWAWDGHEDMHYGRYGLRKSAWARTEYVRADLARPPVSGEAESAVCNKCFAVAILPVLRRR